VGLSQALEVPYLIDLLGITYSLFLIGASNMNKTHENQLIKIVATSQATFSFATTLSERPIKTKGVNQIKNMRIAGNQTEINAKDNSIL